MSRSSQKDLKFEVVERMRCSRQRLGLRWVRGEGTYRFPVVGFDLVPEMARESGVSPVPRQPPQSKALARMRHSFAGGTPLWFFLTLVTFAYTSALPGQATPGSNTLTIISSNAQPPSVGMEGQMEVILPEAGLSTKVPDRRTPMLLRIAFTRPHGTLTHYDLRYIGRVPGQYDLRDYLVTADGNPATNCPALPVSVTGILPQPHNGWLEEQALRAPSLFGGYRAVAAIVVALWIFAFFAILRVGRKPKTATVQVPVQRPPTFAERLRPLVERAAAGGLSADEKAALERMLINHWQRRLGLTATDSGQLIARIRQHPEAGVLLLALEDWLHRPPGSVKVQMDSVLAPYRDLPAEEPVEVAR